MLGTAGEKHKTQVRSPHSSTVQQEVNNVPVNDSVFRQRNLVAGNHNLRIVVLDGGKVSELPFPVLFSELIRYLNINFFILLSGGDKVDLFIVDASCSNSVASANQIIVHDGLVDGTI